MTPWSGSITLGSLSDVVPGSFVISLEVTMTTVLTTLGIGEDSERLYRRILRQDGRLVADYAGELEWPVTRLEVALRPLTELRLVRQDLRAALVAPHPRSALNRLVERETARLDLRRRELADLAAAVGDFSADHLAGRADVLDPAAINVIPAELAGSTVEDLVGSTAGPLRSAQLAVARGPATDPGVAEQVVAAVRAGREFRSVYPISVLDQPGHLEWVREWADLGEQQRLVERVPGDYAVLGDEVVITAPVWGQAASSVVLIRLPLLVSAFTEMFDATWASGLPVPDVRGRQNADSRLLTLLATGYKDEAIARYLGLGVRTVRRRIAVLMQDLNVNTRFQLGVLAERRGLLGRQP
jgi:DNA-binding CsgD family transcriptional regulator